MLSPLFAAVVRLGRTRAEDGALHEPLQGRFLSLYILINHFVCLKILERILCRIEFAR